LNEGQLDGIEDDTIFGLLFGGSDGDIDSSKVYTKLGLSVGAAVGNVDESNDGLMLGPGFLVGGL